MNSFIKNTSELIRFKESEVLKGRMLKKGQRERLVIENEIVSSVCLIFQY